MTTIEIIRRVGADWRAVATLEWDGRTLRGKTRAGLSPPDLRQLASCLSRGEPVGWVNHDTAYRVPADRPDHPASQLRTPPTDRETLGLPPGPLTVADIRAGQRAKCQAATDAAERLAATLTVPVEDRHNPDLDAVFGL